MDWGEELATIPDGRNLSWSFYGLPPSGYGHWWNWRTICSEDLGWTALSWCDGGKRWSSTFGQTQASPSCLIAGIRHRPSVKELSAASCSTIERAGLPAWLWGPEWRNVTSKPPWPVICTKAQSMMATASHKMVVQSRPIVADGRWRGSWVGDCCRDLWHALLSTSSPSTLLDSRI